MTQCDSYNLVLSVLGTIAVISEILPLITKCECNGILHFIMRTLCRQRCADMDSSLNPTAVIELPNVPPRHSVDLRIRNPVERANEGKLSLNPLLPNLN